MYQFLYNDFYFNDRFLLVNSLELALRYKYIIYMAAVVITRNIFIRAESSSIFFRYRVRVVFHG